MYVFIRLYCWFGPVAGPVRWGPPGQWASPTRFFSMRAGFGHVTRHVGQHDPARSINGPCLARPYSYRTETGSGRVRAGWPIWTSIRRVTERWRLRRRRLRYWLLLGQVKELIKELIGSIDGAYNRPTICRTPSYRGRFGPVPRRSPIESTSLDG
jgi:hypothetical protein